MSIVNRSGDLCWSSEVYIAVVYARFWMVWLVNHYGYIPKVSLYHFHGFGMLYIAQDQLFSGNKVPYKYH